MNPLTHNRQNPQQPAGKLKNDLEGERYSPHQTDHQNHFKHKVFYLFRARAAFRNPNRKAAPHTWTNKEQTHNSSLYRPKMIL